MGLFSGERLAERGDATVETVRLPCFAYVAPVKNQPVVGKAHFVGRNVFHQRFLGGEWRFGVVGKSDAVAYAKDVRVNSHGCFVPDDGEHDVSRLSAYSGELHESVNV